MKKIVQAFVVLSLLFCINPNTHAQNNPNKGVLFTTSSNEALSFFTDGLKYYDLGENTKAREYLQKAIKQDPAFASAYIYLATIAPTQQEFVVDLDKAKENISTANQWEKLLYNYTETYLTDNTEKRLAVAQTMTTTFPTSARACLYLGQAYENRNDFMNARKCFQKAVSLEPKWSGGYMALTNSYLFEDPKDFKQAEKTASQLVGIVPTGSTYILLGDTYRAQNNLKSAEEMYTKALDDQSPSGYYKRGHVLSLEGQYDKARQDYEKAGSLDIIPTAASQFKANTYLFAGEPAKALESLQNDIEKIAPTLDGSNSNQFKLDLLTSAALIAIHTQNAEKLDELIKMAQPLSEDIGNRAGTTEAKLAQKSSMLYLQAMLQAIKNDLTGAVQTAEEIKTTMEPVNNPLKLDGYDFILGYVAMQQKDFAKAINHFEKTNKLDVYNQYWLAKAYEAAGKNDKANAIYKYLSNYNFNNLGFALVRNEVKKRM
ncbi:MAG: tetratricopeptide repeat protein [Flavisolibacter sp.]|nr:tetratricopeptide repeat protein [Flavisolibacter sp.]